MLFLPNQQELDCFNDSGELVGKIKFNAHSDKHEFHSESETSQLTNSEQLTIAERLAGLDLGKFSIPMQDDD